MAKKNTEEVMVVSPELQKNLDIIQAFKSQVDLIGLNCQQIQIVDETSLAVGQQNLSKANNLLSSIEEKRVAIKAPYFTAGKLIDETAKGLAEQLAKGIKHIKDEVAAWEKKRQAEAKAKQDEINRQLEEKRKADEVEEKRKENLRAEITKLSTSLKLAYDNCTTVEICNTKLQNIETKFKSREFFQEYADEAYQIRDTYVDLIKSKKEQLESANTMSAAEIEFAQKQEKLAIEKANLETAQRALDAEKARIEKEKKDKEAALEAEKEKERLADEAELNRTKNIRYTWKHELVDIKSVPLDWLTLDEAKVKEFIKANKDSLKDGEIKDGVKFIKAMGVVS